MIVFDPGNYTPHYNENLCGALSNLGVDVELISSPALFEQTEHREPFTTRELFFPSVGGTARSLFLRHALFRQALRALTYPLGLWRTWRTVKDRAPGIFHVQWSLLPVLDAMLLRKLRSKGWRIVYTAHDLLSELARPANRRQWRRIYRQTDAVIVHTSGLEQVLRERSGDMLREVLTIPEGTSTFPFSPNVDRCQARKILGLDCDAPHLLFFGMIKPYKGLQSLLRAWPRVLSEFPRAKLLIAGEPMSSFSSYDQLIDTLGIRHSVELKLGYVPSREVQYYFSAADAVVLPYVQISTSGVVPLAYQYSRPIIATAIGGMPEIVKDGETGFLVKPGSELALSEAICRGFHDPSLLCEMGDRGHAWFQKEHSWSEVARQTLELYRSLQ